jgi:DNA-binding GntR family transcriptional regulator
MLRSEGYVRGVPGTGTVVSALSYPGRDRLQAIAGTGRIYPPNERAVIKSSDLVPAPADIVDALGLTAGAEVMSHPHRVTLRDDKPVSASTTWMPGTLAADAPRLLTTERIIEGTVGYVGAMRGPDRQIASDLHGT